MPPGAAGPRRRWWASLTGRLAPSTVAPQRRVNQADPQFLDRPKEESDAAGRAQSRVQGPRGSNPHERGAQGK